VPHGDSVLALGKAAIADGAPDIAKIDGLPLGVTRDLGNPYLAPYKHFIDAPFKGVVSAPGFPGFRPDDATALLRGAVPGTVRRTTTLHVDSTLDHAGIGNIPFVVRQANAASMNSTFWIMEMEEMDAHGHPLLFLQYAQSILLDFFDKGDGNPGKVQWPHISINTMQKVSEPQPSRAKIEMTS
ncbi:MAG: hypothetical protein LJE68_10775, partial [Rhodobacter sp.]|nr:hypothetical protein [Rhodobacter sp.]